MVVQKFFYVNQCSSRNSRFWFPARPEGVFNRRHSMLFRGLKTSENAAGGRKMLFLDNTNYAH
jgi:hypothetical protein